MKIIKSFTDENGQEVLVQGAGTDYNQELNSLAIGEGTVAAGEDQFVFGKYNTPETDKVEIVGSGNYEEVQRYGLGEYCAPSPLTYHRGYYGGKNLEELVQALKVVYNNCEVTFDVRSPLPTDIVTFLILERDRKPENKISSSLVFRTSDGTWYLDSSAYLGFNGYHSAYAKEQITSVNVTFMPRIISDTYVLNVWENIYKTLFTISHNEKNIRTLDWEGNEVLAGELTSKKVNTKSVKLEDDVYSRLIDAQEASLMPKIVEISSQTVKVTNPITQNKLDIAIPNISEIGMLAKSNKFLKLVVNEESTKTIWGLQLLTNSTITFRNVKTTLIDNVFYETIIEIIYALDLPTASVMHKVADLQTGDILYYLATSLS